MTGTESFEMSDGKVVRLGCKLPPEMRFAAVPTWAEANEVLPQSEWREHDDYAAKAPKIKYQHANNCTNASLAGLAELLWVASGNDPVTLSMSFLYSLCNGGQDEGAFCRDLAAKFLDTGLPTDALAPENKILARSWPQEVLDDAKKRRALEIYQIMSFEEAASALSRDFLIYHGFCLGSRFFNTGSDGVVPSYDGKLANGHAMYSRGLTRINGVWRTITPNSWSESFGKNGVGLLDSSYFWNQRGNFVNLDCFAVRALKQNVDGIPLPA